MELDSLRADNERLLIILKSTCEYQGMTDSEILKEAKANLLNKSKAGSNYNSRSTKARGKSAGHNNSGLNQSSSSSSGLGFTA